MQQPCGGVVKRATHVILRLRGPNGGVFVDLTAEEADRIGWLLVDRAMKPLEGSDPHELTINAWGAWDAAGVPDMLPEDVG